MAIDKVKEYFRKFNKEDEILEFDESTSTVYEASLRLNCTEDEIAKTLSFIVDDKPIVIVMSGKSKVDNHKFKDEFKVKAKMIERERVEELTNHAPGGVCPFALKEGVEVYLDESLKKHDIVYPACGSSNSCIKLTTKELEKYSNYVKYVDVTSLT